jgi:tetratricopeptide (TPR) repeat protein
LFGKFDEAEIEMRRARELDPLSSAIRAFIRGLLYRSRQYDRGLEEAAEEIKLHDSPALHNYVAGTYLVKGDYARALMESENALSGSSADERPYRISTLACIYAKTGRKEEAIKILKELEELSKQNPIYYEDLAAVHYCLGDYNETLRMFERAYDEHSELLPFSLTDPLYDGLRSNSRYIALRKTMGLDK